MNRPRIEMGGSQTCGCLIEEGHAPLILFAGGSALPSAHDCRTNQKVDEQFKSGIGMGKALICGSEGENKINQQKEQIDGRNLRVARSSIRG